MAGQLLGFAATGQAGMYMQIRSQTTGQIANGSAMEAYNQAHWANYVISASEQAGSGCYAAGVPGYLPADRYVVTLYTPLTGSPASGDTPVWDTSFDWDGSNVLGSGSAVNVGKINGSSTAASNLGVSTNAFVLGAAVTGTLTTLTMTTNLANGNANIYAGRVLIFTSGNNQGRAALITAYNPTGGLLTFTGYNNTPINSAPVNGDTFIIV
jgi:hypothetical protein